MGRAWVEYTTGQIFNVSIANAACTATPYQANTDNMALFGMGFVTDSAGRIDTINRAACAALGAEPAQMLGLPALEVLPPRIAEPLARNEALRDVEAEFVTPSGGRWPICVLST